MIRVSCWLILRSRSRTARIACRIWRCARTGRLVRAGRLPSLQDRDLDAFLDVPVVGRTDRSPSFAVDPPKRPMPVVTTQTQAAQGFAPEPAISEDGFAAILSEIESVTTAVQRLPKSFATMPEESLRDVLLVMLNNRFGPASGETFSRAGKTDIFIPWGGDQRAVFIAECKWWKGPAAFRRGIDQLLGYTAWRDSRVALVVFVREGSPSDARSLRRSYEHTRRSNAWHKLPAGHRSRLRVATTNGGRCISRWSSFRYLSDYRRSVTYLARRGTAPVPASISTSRHEERRNGCRRVVVHGRKNMRVGLQRDRDVRVAEPFLHDTGVNSGL